MPVLGLSLAIRCSMSILLLSLSGSGEPLLDVYARSPAGRFSKPLPGRHQTYWSTSEPLCASCRPPLDQRPRFFQRHVSAQRVIFFLQVCRAIGPGSLFFVQLSSTRIFIFRQNKFPLLFAVCDPIMCFHIRRQRQVSAANMSALLWLLYARLVDV